MCVDQGENWIISNDFLASNYMQMKQLALRPEYKMQTKLFSQEWNNYVREMDWTH